MTYGRVAWLTVIVIGGLISVFGFAGGRRTILIVGLGCALAVSHFGLHSNMFMIDRIIKRTDMAMNVPLEGASERERFLSYTEPLEHLMDNPIWLMAGAGRTGERMSRRGNLVSQLYDEAGLATHSAFAMAYYCFGLPAAICQVLLMISAFRYILRRAGAAARRKQQEQLLCQNSGQTITQSISESYLDGRAL